MIQQQNITARAIIPPPLRGRLGGGSFVLGNPLHRPPTPTLPRKGGGSKDTAYDDVGGMR